MKSLSIGEVAVALGVSVPTLRRWDLKNKFKPSFRTFGGHRRYSWSQITQLISNESSSFHQKVVCYARVSSSDQKEDLVRQGQRLLDWCKSQKLNSPELISDLGSGLNYKKSGLKRLFRMIALHQISHLVITHKDRLLRFGSELIFELCRLNNIQVTLICAIDNINYEQQLAADVIELMTVFSARLYGARSHQNKAVSAGI